MSLVIQDAEQHGLHVRTWMIDAPDRGNGIGPTIALALDEALEHVKAAKQIQVLCISANPVGEKPIWIAGGDLVELARLKSQEEVRRYIMTMRRVCDGLRDLPIPVICAVDGYVIGGGVELSLAADVRLATMRSIFEFRQLQVGLATGYGGTKRLVECCGRGIAERLIYGGERLDALTALSMGLVHRVAVDEQHLRKMLDTLYVHMKQWHGPSFAAQKRMFEEDDPELFYPLWGNPKHREVLAKFSE